MSTHRHGTAVGGLRKWLRRRRHGMVYGVLQVLVFAATVFFFSGYMRGETADNFAGGMVTWVQDTAYRLLADGWVDPSLARAVVVLLTYAGFAVLLLTAASFFRRIPAFIGFLVVSEFHRRQGHKLSALELLLGLSLPIALTVAMTCRDLVSLYACAHVSIGYAYVRASNDPRRIDNVLNWYVRIRTASDNTLADTSVEMDDVEAEEDDA